MLRTLRLCLFDALDFLCLIGLTLLLCIVYRKEWDLIGQGGQDSEC